MTLTNSLSKIVTRINQGSLTEADLQALAQIISSATAQGDRAVAIAGDAQAATITTGDGNVVLNVVFQADGLQIAGQLVQGKAVEMLRQLLQGSLPAIEIDWQQVSRSLLNEQIQRLTTNPLTHAEGIVYKTEQVYVPLGLVERKKVSRRGEDVSPEQGSLLYEETEITRKFEHEDFLEQVLRQGQSPKSQGKRIAVIGEPGAGKTTLLQQMARWVAEHIERSIAIWVSLADLQGRLLEDYLLEQWLPAAVQQQGQAAASKLVKDAFVAQVNAGRVWLWLDGVDEMAVDNPLGEIERQRKEGGLLLQSRIVLTCRLNVWDGNRHTLDTFDVYRTLEFAYPGQVDQFVGQWFGALQPDAQVGQADRLCEALRRSGQERLRDLVKNPLRLTLLCFNWYLGEGTLPETKAGLYEQFVADFYVWKRERFHTTAAQRGQLNTALGELAREAIDKEEMRFRLRHDFVCEFLGEPDEPDSLFQMALRLGWLNQIGVDAENRRKAVYAFFHPTFQEYFAALAIDDYHFFFNHIPEGIRHPESSYRIFEPQFKEVLLLWLGQTKDILEDEKNKLVQNVMEFKDGCGEYYTVQAICLASVSIGEFKNCKSSDLVISEISRLCFGFFDDQKTSWQKFSDPVPWLAEIALLESDRQRVIDIIVNSIVPASINHLYPNKDAALKAAKFLGLLGQDSLKAVKALIQLIRCEDLIDKTASFQPVSSFLFVRIEASKSLAKIASGNEQAIHNLKKALSPDQREEIQMNIIETLGQLAPDDTFVIDFFTKRMQSCNDETMRLQSAWGVLSFNSEHELTRKVLFDLSNSADQYISTHATQLLEQGAVITHIRKGSGYTQNEMDEAENIWTNSNCIFDLLCQHIPNLARSWAISEILEQAKLNYPRIVQELTGQLHICKDTLALQIVVQILGDISAGDEYVVKALIDFLKHSNSLLGATSKTFYQLFKSSNKRQLCILTVIGLKDYIKHPTASQDMRRTQIYEIIWLCAEQIGYEDFYYTWHN